MRPKRLVGWLLLMMTLTSCRQYMSNQPRYNTYRESDFFADGSASRPLPEGVVSQERDRSEHVVRGTVDGKEAATFPFAITIEVLERGQQRFDIYCTPCHDHLGTGQGMAVLRGFRQQPPSFHEDRLRAANPGYFFDVITNGFGAMPSYAFQIQPRDRWAVIAYVKALQLSRNSTTADVPADDLKKLEAEKQ